MSSTRLKNAEKKNMGKVVLNMKKAKAGTSGGLTNHIDRTQQNEISGNIDLNRINQNFELAEVSGTIDEMAKKIITENYKGKRAIRNDAVTTQRYILGGSHEEMKALSRLDLMNWAKDSYKFFADKYGEQNIVRATVHCDEKTPHMHMIVVPLTSDGRLSAKDFTGDSKKLKQMQTDYAKVVAKYGLDRGVEGSNRKHITTKDYYRYINANELEANSLLQHPNAPDLIAKLIELADNKSKLKHVAHKPELSKLQQNEQGFFERDKPGEKERENNRRTGFSM